MINFYKMFDIAANNLQLSTFPIWLVTPSLCCFQSTGSGQTLLVCRQMQAVKQVCKLKWDEKGENNETPLHNLGISDFSYKALDNMVWLNDLD